MALATSPERIRLSWNSSVSVAEVVQAQVSYRYHDDDWALDIITHWLNTRASE